MNENLINADNLDPHEILNVSQNASIDEIRKARNKLAREFHPDTILFELTIKSEIIILY